MAAGSLPARLKHAPQSIKGSLSGIDGG